VQVISISVVPFSRDLCD